MRRILVGTVPCFAALAGSVVVALGADPQRLEPTPKVGEGGWVGQWAIYRSIIKQLRLNAPGQRTPDPNTKRCFDAIVVTYLCGVSASR